MSKQHIEHHEVNRKSQQQTSVTELQRNEAIQNGYVIKNIGQSASTSTQSLAREQTRSTSASISTQSLAREHMHSERRQQTDRAIQEQYIREQHKNVHAEHHESRRKHTQSVQHTSVTQQQTVNDSRRSHSQTSSEFRHALEGSGPSTEPVKSLGHHRKNIITSSSTDLSNSVLHRKSVQSSTEALHTISSTASEQKKSLSNLHGQYLSLIHI